MIVNMRIRLRIQGKKDLSLQLQTSGETGTGFNARGQLLTSFRKQKHYT